MSLQHSVVLHLFPPSLYQWGINVLLMNDCNATVTTGRGGGLVAETWIMGREGLWFDSTERLQKDEPGLICPKIQESPYPV